MKRRFSSLAAAAVFATLTPATAATVDFEGLAPGVYAAGTDFSGLSFDQDVQIDAFSFLDGPATDGNIARQFKKTGQFTSDVGGSIGGSFSASISALTLGAGDVCCDLDKIVLTGFDASGNVVDTDTYTGQASGFLSIAGTGIVSYFLKITDVNSSGSSGFDNFSFDFENAAPVPLPASLPMLVLGVAGLGFVGKRNSKRA